MSSKTYWRDRELEWKKKRLKDEKQYADEIQEIYANMRLLYDSVRIWGE